MTGELDKVDEKYDSVTGKILIKTEVQGIQYEGRTPRIEKIKLGAKMWKN